MDTSLGAVPSPTARWPPPVLLLWTGGLSGRGMDPLTADGRIAVFSSIQLAPELAVLAQRFAIVVAVSADPLATLVHLRSAGITIPIVLAVEEIANLTDAEVIAAGAAIIVTVPLTSKALGDVVALAGALPAIVQVYGGSLFMLDPVGHLVLRGNKIAHLTPTEFALLHCLSQLRGTAINTSDLFRHVWGNREVASQSQLVALYVLQIRRKLAPLDLAMAIRTVRGFGYALQTRE